MKKIIRTVLFIFLSLYATDWVVGGFSYSENKTIHLSVIALLVLYLFLKPIASVASLPTSGSVFFLISFISTGIVFYALANIIHDLSFQPTTLRSLNILGVVLPSKDLDSLWSLIFSALTTSSVYLFLEGLCSRKK
jgi:uncharacterized membrane protein YvlD (DUF360 family)